MTDLRLELRLKNQRLWEVTVGSYGSVAEFCRANGKESLQSNLGTLLNLTASPWGMLRTKHAKSWGYRPLRPFARWLCRVTGVGADELFPEHLYRQLLTGPIVTLVEGSQFIPLIEAPRDQLLLPAPDEDGGKVFTDEMKAAIGNMVATLGRREQKVLRLRFGLDGGEEQTLGSVAKALGVSPERIRQMEATALRKMRHPSRARKLHRFIRA